jgi:hypothetical protein
MSAYPNPFKGTKMLQYALPISGRVSLKVFDLSGGEVADLVSGEQQAGFHKAVWNAANSSAGVYFVRLSAGGAIHSRRMLLLK